MKRRINLLVVAIIAVVILLPCIALEARAYSAEDYQAYLPIVGDFFIPKEVETGDGHGHIYSLIDDIYGMLYDVDGNGVAELILTYRESYKDLLIKVK